MKNLMRNGRRTLFASVLLGSMALLFAPAPASAASPAVSGVSPETLRLGERIYREGVLPSGERLRVSVKGGVSAPGTTFTCVSCHLRSGLGALEEGVYTPPISGEKLFQPLKRLYKGVEQSAEASHHPLRPAYTEESLMAAVRNGTDPAGRVLSEVMPRYLLEDKDARLLAAYLKTLSSQASPGVSDTTVRFATVVSEDIRPEISDTMITTLSNYFAIMNNQIRTYANPQRIGPRSRSMLKNMSGSWGLTAKTITHVRWTLKGPSSTWRTQLEEYNRQDPVFALLGGMVSGPWKPVHQFCEDNRIPCLFPNTDLPVVSDTNWYTLYLSKGYHQEGECAARYLNSREELLKGRPVVQVVRDSPEAEALSAGFQQQWQDLGRQDLVTVLMPRGSAADIDTLRQALDREKPAVLILWDDATAVPALEVLGRGRVRPERVLLSARGLEDGIWSLQESIRDFTYMTYPFEFSPVVFEGMGQQQTTLADKQKTLREADLPLKDEKQKILQLTNALAGLTSSMLMDMKGNYYRDYLLDIADMRTDQQYPLYGKISLGGGQRYATRGCYIVQLTRGEKPELVKRSEWISQ